jgi:hypothetical protein
LLPNHVEVIILLIRTCLVNFFLVIRLLNSSSLILYVGILYLSGGNFRFLLIIIIPVSGVCIFNVLCSSLIGCAESVGISLASRVTYIFVCVSLRCVECRAGTSMFGYFGGVGGGTVRIFYFPWLCFGGWSVFLLLLSSVCCQFSWRVDMLGRNIVYFPVVFCSGFLRFPIYELLIVDNLLQVVP